MIKKIIIRPFIFVSVLSKENIQLSYFIDIATTFYVQHLVFEEHRNKKVKQTWTVTVFAKYLKINTNESLKTILCYL